VRTVVFQAVRDEILGLMVWGPTVATADQIHACTDYLQAAVRRGWEFDFFPEWTVLEERTFAADHSLLTTYGLADMVWDPTGEDYYKSAQAANLNHALTETAWWTPYDLVAPTDTVLAREAAGKTSMGEVAAVYETEEDGLRDVVDGSGRRVDYALTPTGMTLFGVVPNSVWVRFRKQPPRFSTTLWSAGGTYPAGYVVLWPATATSDEQTGGECYMAVQDAAGAYSWLKQDLPAILERYAMLATMADLLRREGQPERAGAAAADAEDELDRAWRVSMGQQGVMQRTRFRGCY